MKVLIVAKTRRGSRACVGGITFDGQSVRLVAANAETNERAGMEYEIGEVWEVEALPPPSLTPPHVENIVVHARRKLGPMTDPVPFIERHLPAQPGGLEVLFDGLPQTTSAGALYIAERSGVPAYSTMFWRPDRPLALQDAGKVSRYAYLAPEGRRTLAFVGFQTPVTEIPAGTLVRVSLAHWWRPEDDPEAELRCYVQISGWFLAAAQTRGQPAAAPPTHAQLPERRPAAPPLAAPDPATMRGLLKTVFGYDSFRPLQEEIVANLLARRDTLAVMPTGSGKSLCYQLPALLLPGLTVVVSPLIALMQDQVDELRQLGVPAVFLNSSLAYADYGATVARVRRGEIKLLYTSPETLLAPATLNLLDRCQVDCLTIDEAHCISAWGHDFRPEYRELVRVRKRYPDAVCMAFTATATPRVQRDIQETLELRDENQFIASFDRPNLYLQVQPRAGGVAQVLAFLQRHRDESGIIYCSTRLGVETLTARLQDRGWPALPYHAGMDDETRRRHQSLFSRDQAPIIVATIAFGMGINKSNVRFVLHYNLPESLESYYQEIGRAGRDGLPADCLLLFSRSDLQTIYRFIEEGAERERAGRHARLQAMVRYAEAAGCRRSLLLSYFSEASASERCDFCDNCAGTGEERAEIDVTEQARTFLECVKLTGQVFGPARIVEILRGSQAQEIVRRHLDRLPVYGAGKETSARAWRGLAEELIRRGLLAQDMEFGGLSLTDGGRRVLDGERVFVSPAQPERGAAGRDEIADPELFELLRRLRRRLAEAANVPPYVVFSDRSLADMSFYRPQSPASLLAIHGVGQRKLDRYGDEFLEVIRSYCAGRGLAERSQPAESPDAAVALARASAAYETKSRWMEVGELFAAGRTVPELEALYGVKRVTIVQHLCRYVQAHLPTSQPLAPERVRALCSLAPADQERVLAALKDLGTDHLRPVYEALGEAIPYDELHILRAYLLAALLPFGESGPSGEN